MGKARMNAYKDRIAETERVKERKRARVERSAGDVPMDDLSEKLRVHRRLPIQTVTLEYLAGGGNTKSAGVRTCAEVRSC